jgi:acetolactate synthase I/II/III large subunit
VLGDPGPGAINLLLGTADATTNSSPVVALSAQAGLNRIYKESRQSVDLVSMFSPVTKWADVILTPGAVPEMIRKAFKLAQTERPGAVYLAVPEDVEAMGVPEGPAPLNLNIPRPDEPSGPQIERAAAVLDGARQPVVLAVHGAARARSAGALRRFSEQLGLPVATTFHGKGVFPTITRTLSARWSSCGVTTSTSDSTRRTPSSAPATSCRSSTRRGSTRAGTSGSCT